MYVFITHTVLLYFKVNLDTKFTFGIIPLGTGNDLCLQLNQLIPTLSNKRNYKKYFYNKDLNNEKNGNFQNKISENLNIDINKPQITDGGIQIVRDTAGGEGGIIEKNHENFIINLLPEMVYICIYEYV
jgi:hypothetical protein